MTKRLCKRPASNGPCGITPLQKRPAAVNDGVRQGADFQLGKGFLHARRELDNRQPVAAELRAHAAEDRVAQAEQPMAQPVAQLEAELKIHVVESATPVLPIHITAASLAGNATSLSLKPSSTVRELRDRLADKLGLSHHRIQLVLDDTQLREMDRTLAHAGLHSGSHVTVLTSGDRRVVTTSADATARIWNIETGECMQILRGHRIVINTAVFSKDGRHILSGSDDGTARIWSTETGECIAILRGHRQAKIIVVAFSGDGRRAFTASWDMTARVWNAETGVCMQILEDKDRIEYGYFSEDGSRALTGTTYMRDNGVTVWNAEAGKILCKFGTSLRHIGFSLDGRRVVTCSHNGSAKIWNAETGICLKVLLGHGRDILTGSFFSGGERVLTAERSGKTKDMSVRIWNTETGECLQTLPGHSDMGLHHDFSEDGTRSLTVAHGKIVMLLDIEQGSCLQKLQHSAKVSSAVLSSDSRLIITAACDRRIRIWSADTGKCLHVLEGHLGKIRCAALA